MAILSIIKKRDASLIYYTILGNSLERVDSHDFLGVSTSYDLRWKKHYNKINKKANKTLRLLRSTLSPYYKEVKSRTYQTFVRPQLEYAAEAWNPYNITTSDRLEHIQCAAGRFVHYYFRRTTSINILINILRWQHLHTRLLVSQLTMFYEIHYHLVNIHIP